MKTNLFTFSHSVKDLTSAHQVQVLDGSRTIVDTTHRGRSKRSLFLTPHSLILFLSLLLGLGFSSQVWGYASVYLNGDFTGGNWNKQTYQITNYYAEGKYYLNVYASGSDQYWRLYTNNCVSPYEDKYVLNVGATCYGTAYNGEKNFKYTGSAGILKVCIDQTSDDWKPCVWLERPSVKLRHTWDGSNWSQSESMTDNNDGTYTLVKNYSGSSNGYSFYSGYEMDHMSGDKITRNGSPASGDKCQFVANSKTKTVVITRYEKVTYSINGGSGASAPDAQEQLYNQSITLATQPSGLAKTGYNFTGWNTNDLGTGTHYNAGATISNITSDLTLYAEWTPIVSVITINKNDGSGNTHTVSAIYGQTPPTWDPDTRANYVVDYYSNASSGTSPSIVAKVQTTGEVKFTHSNWGGNGTWNKTGASYNIYAIWVNAYTITLDKNATDATAGTITSVMGANATNNPTAKLSNYNLSGDQLPSRTGYTFNGYRTTTESSSLAVVGKTGVWQKSVPGYTSDNYYWILSDNATLYAAWTQKIYDLTILGNYPNSEYSCARQVKYDATSFVGNFEEASRPTRIGYRLKGYYKEPEATTQIAGIGGALVANTPYTDANKKWKKDTANIINLYAGWNANEFSIAFDGNGSTDGTMTNQAFVYEVSENLKKCTYTKTGYTFAGWALSADGEVVYADEADACKATTTHGATVTLYAKWTPNNYQVKFERNNSDGGADMSNQSFEYDETAKALTKNTYTRTGYNFNGWNTAANGSGTAYADEVPVQNLTTVADGVVPLYAQWTAKEYNITLNAGDFSNVTNGAATVLFDASSITITTTPTRTGYNVTNNNSYFSDAQYSDKVATHTGNLTSSSAYTTDSKWSYDAQSTVTLYTKWTAKTYTITFNTNGGATASFDRTFTYDAVPAASGVPTHSTDNFAGYAIGSAEGTLLYNAAGQLIYPVTNYTDNTGKWIYDGAITLYAKWMSNYTITLDGDGATTSGTTSVDVNPNTTILTSIDAVPAKTGYTFGGYFTAKNGGGTQLITDQGVWIRPVEGYIDADGKWIKGSNATLYAKWIVNVTNVSFDKQSGTGGANSRTLKYNSVENMDNIECPTREGYTFEGYYTEVNGTGTKLINADGTWIANVEGYTGTVGSGSKVTWMRPIAGDLTLYANWTENIFDLIVVRRYLDLSGNVINTPPYQDVQEPTSTKAIGIVKSFTTTAYSSPQTGFYNDRWGVAAGAKVKCGSTTTDASSAEQIITGSAGKASIDLTGYRVADDNAITIYDRWKENTRNVTVSATNGTIQGSVSQVTVGVYTPQTVTAVANIGYDFVNWTTNPATVNYVINLSASGSLTTEVRVTSSVKTDGQNAGSITANFVAQVYNITYKDQGDEDFTGIHEDGYPTQHTYDATTTLKSATKTGYTFIGWYKTAACEGDPVATIGGTDYTANFTLYAKWTPKQYIVLLDNQGATTAGAASLTATYNASMPTLSAKPEKTGYTFDGYYTEPSGAGTMYINGSGSSAKNWDIDKDNTTLYAKWNPNTNTPYTVKHYKQDIDGTYPSEAFATDELTGTTATSVTPAVKSGDAITGFTAPATQTVTILADGSLVVRYEYTRNSYALSWNFAGGSLYPAEQSYTQAGDIKYGATITAPTLAKTGYNFSTWSPAFVNPMPAEAKPYIAQWTAKQYTVTLDNQGATITGAASVTATYNATVPSIAGNLPAKTGFTFDGYFTLADGGDQIIKSDGTSTYTWQFDENKTLYAHWTTIYAYLEGRTKIKNQDGTETVLNDKEQWDLNLKTIPFTFNSTNGVYYLNTRLTTYDLASYIGGRATYIRVGTAVGASSAVTCYSAANSSDYKLTSANKGHEMNTTNNSSFYFRDVEKDASTDFARRGPVMYRFNPSTMYFDYCAPLLTLTYSGTTATMTGYAIAKANASVVADGIADDANKSITYQYKQGDSDWQTWSSDITAAAGTYKLRAVASGNNEFGQAVTDVISNEITVTVTTPAISAQVTHVNGNPGSIIRINDSFTIKHTVTGVPADQSVMVCYHWSKKPAGSAIQHDIFTPVKDDQTSVYTSIDVAGDYEIEVSIANDVCQDSLSNPDYIKWQSFKLPIHVKGDEITVYARLDTKITDWEKKFVYYWKDAAGTWPGYKMSYIGKDSTDYEWYSYNIDNYKTYQGGKLLFNDSTTRYGQYQTNNVNMPNDDEFYFIKTAMTGGKRDVALDPHIDVTRRVILQTDTTALYQYVTITLEGKGVFFANREEMNYAYAITTKPDGSVAALNAKNQFTPDKAGDYTVTIRCEAGSLSAENTFVLHVQENKLQLTASVGATSTIGTATTVTVSADQAIAGTKTFTVIEPGTNSPITFSTKTTENKSVASDSYTLLSSGMYIFSVVVVNDGKIAGKAQDTVTVAPKTYYIKHPFVNKEAKDIQGDDWSWKQLTYNEIDGTYQYKGDDAYFHPTKVANINTTNGGDKLKEYTIVNPDNLEDKAKCIFVYDITTDKVTVYALNKRLYRIKSTCQDNEYFSNAVTYDDGNPSLTQQVSFFAQKGGALNWQTRETAAHDWVDGTAITTTAAASGIYTATPTKAQTDFSLTAYTDSLFVFSQVVTVNSSEHSPTALNGKLTEFTKKSSSEYYNHYWVRYVEASTQAMATMGNRINNCIATTLPYYVMPAKGNVRYAYDNTTNHFSRTFLAGSGDADFLRVYGERLDTLRKNTVDQYDAINSLTNSRKFDDGSDWIYTTKASGEVSTSASVTAILTTKYNGMNRWVLAESGLEADPDAKRDILSKDAAKPGRYDLTLIYDYKTNRLTAGAQPAPGTVVTDTMVIDQLILSREGDGSATQFTLADKAKLIVVDKMTVEFDVTKDMYDAWQDEGKGGSGYKIMYFWFSVPYECHINEIYGLGVYGEKFEIQRYRGDLRAAGSAGSSTGSSAWRKLKSTATMEANRGYVIAMRVAASDFKSATIGGETKSIIRLFFPSVGKVELTHEVKTVLQQNESNKTSNLHWNWNIMGNPLVKDGKELIVDSAESAELNFVYVWTWGGGARTYEPYATNEVTLQSTHSYMVQGYGNVYWAYPTVTKSPARYLEAAHFASEDSYGKLNLRLNISQDDQLLDKTYILYREDGDRDEYEMGRDLEKIINSGVTQMYASPNNNLAAVCLNSEDKNMIPLTVIANTDGNYTFSLHRQLNSDLEPTIYDALTQQYTNLSMGSCNVVLTKGTYTNRFFFLLRKTGVVTNMGELNSNNYGEGVQKIILNEQLYILRDGKVYRATGSLVK